MPSKQIINEYKASVTKRGRTKRFNTWNYTSKNRLAGPDVYQSKIN